MVLVLLTLGVAQTESWATTQTSGISSQAEIPSHSLAPADESTAASTGAGSEATQAQQAVKESFARQAHFDPRLKGHSLYNGSNVELIGHGWGHGIGMGQWGALGYALDGESYQWILDHYYGGTTVGSVANDPLKVVITGNDGNYPIITSDSTFTVGAITFQPGQAVMFAPDSTGGWNVFQGGSCAGPWSGSLADEAQPIVVPQSSDPNATSSQVLQICEAGGNGYYRGDFEPAYYQVYPRTVNIVPIESYLRGVVPSESPAYWGSLGGPGAQGQQQGFQELEVQAVAARSYAEAARGEYGYADICDSTSCQVYGGMNSENSLTDLAVSGTAGEIMQTSSGASANTMFSASTGGYTSSSGQFPAAVDAGDSVCVASACNPNHVWSTDISVSSIESYWPQIGSLSSISVTSRNGLGDFGGRVGNIQIVGTNGTENLSGSAFEGAFGLNSDWFINTGYPSGGEGGYWLVSAQGGVYSYGDSSFFGSAATPSVPSPIVGAALYSGGAGYWIASADGTVYAFGGAPNLGNAPAPVVSMATTPDGLGYWLVTSQGAVYPFGDAKFFGSATNLNLFRPINGIATTPDGQGYWLVASDGGIFAYGDAQFFGSTGGSILNKPVIGMASTPDGKGYWLVAADGGLFAYGDGYFHGSLPGIGETNTATAMVPTPDGGGYTIVTQDGGVHPFGDAPIFGDLEPQSSGFTGSVVALMIHPG